MIFYAQISPLKFFDVYFGLFWLFFKNPDFLFNRYFIQCLLCTRLLGYKYELKSLKNKYDA